MFASVYITVGSEHEAKGIAKNLLDSRLIACANLFPINSLYYWKDKFQEDKEYAIIMKTRSDLIKKLIKELKKIHSYDVPCIVSWDISNGNPDYLSWIKKETLKSEERDEVEYRKSKNGVVVRIQKKVKNRKNRK